MPLDYISQPLDIPADAYNKDDLAVLLIEGSLHVGNWSIRVIRPLAASGGIDTTCPDPRAMAADSRYPLLALESLFIWLRAETQTRGLLLAHFENLNSRYSAADAPYFCAAQAVIGSPKFTRQPGVQYADEWTLDRAMGGNP